MTRSRPVRARVAVIKGEDIKWQTKPKHTDFGTWELTYQGASASISRSWDGRASLQVHYHPHRPGKWLYFAGHVATVQDAQAIAEEILPVIAATPEAEHPRLSELANSAFDAFRNAVHSGA